MSIFIIMFVGVAVSTLFLKTIEHTSSKRVVPATRTPLPVLTPYWQWADDLNKALDRQTLETIDNFDPDTLQSIKPKTVSKYRAEELRKETDANIRKKYYERQSSITPVSPTVPPVYVYREYEEESYEVIMGDGSIARTYKHLTGKGEPVAILKESIYDAVLLSEYDIWVCPKHKHSKWKTRRTGEMNAQNQDYHRTIGKDLNCADCLRDKEDLKRQVQAIRAVPVKARTFDGAFLTTEWTEEDL